MIYISPSDTEIHRGQEVRVIDKLDGSTIFTLHRDTPNKRAMQILDLLNSFYDKGYKAGRMSKVLELKKVLEVED